MKLIQVAVILGYFSIGHSYTKYGRSCKDIGCPSNQECVIQTDPCSYYHRQGECGSFPTCQRTSNSARTCTTYVCPPTKVCKMDGTTPKCIDDTGKVGHVSYNTQNQQSVNGPEHSASGSAVQSGNLYPQLRGQTTPRPNINRPLNSGSNGYQGGQIGSGYPGQQPSHYPQQGAYPGYPQQVYPNQAYPQQAYPNQAYPQQAYPQQAYPQQQGNYPRQPYPQQGYPQQGAYPQQQGNYRQGQYPPNPTQNYGTQQKSGGQSITDKISNSLKNIGGLLKNQLGIK